MKLTFRYGMLVALGGLMILALAVIWAMPEVPRQARNIRSAIILLSGTCLFLLWFLFFSRLPLPWRLLPVIVISATLLIGQRYLKISGVTGDLLPIIELRHSNASLPPPLLSPENPPVKVVEGEFLQFMGPERNGTIPEVRLKADWSESPPEILWRSPVGAGWSGFAIKDGRAVTQEQHGTEERVVCYEAISGRVLWTHSDTTQYSTIIAGEGPRATPAISGHRVYTVGATGILNCLDLRSGKLYWRRNVLEEHGRAVPEWGLAGSPLVQDDQVIVSVGGDGTAMVAYSAGSGELAWKGGSGGGDYSSPVGAILHGVRQIMLFDTRGVLSLDTSGRELWSYPWPGGHPHVSMPLVVWSNQVFISSGYGTGCELVQITQSGHEWSATRVWRSMALKSKFGPLLLHKAHVYGLDDGIFSCVEVKTGKRKWKDGRYGHGQALLFGDKILLTSEKGELLLIEANPEKLIELGRFPVFGEKTWNPPAFAGGYLLMRNHRETACIKLATEPKNPLVSFANDVFTR